MLNMRFHIYADAQHQQADPESSECSGRKPSPLLSKGEAECECSQSDSQHRRSKQIESLLLVPLRFLLTIEVKRSVEKEYANWHVDIKNPTPGQELGNDSSDCRPGGNTQRDHHCIQAQC